MAVFENREAWTEEFENGWLKHYQETGETNFKLYTRPRNENGIAGPAIDLSRSRLVFISSAGAYLKDIQPPFDAPNLLGDYSLRVFPVDVAFDSLAYAHDHYDHTAVNDDPQVLLPLHHLADMVAEGHIGELAPNVISYMGYQPDARLTEDETIPAVVEAAKAQNAQAALLVPS